MSAIFGFFNSNQNTTNDDLVIKNYETALCREPWMHSTTKKFAGGFIGVADIGPESALVDTDTFTLVFCGTLVNRDNSFGPPTVAEIKQNLSSLYSLEGIQGLTALNGLFVIAVWNKQNQRLELINNQIGIQKCYYAKQNGSFHFSSEYKTILTNPTFKKSIDVQSVTEWFFLGYQLEEKTFFKDIFALPAGNILVYQDDQIKLTPYWQPKYHEQGDLTLTEEEYIEGFADQFQRSISRRISPNTTLMLSGGIDSRTILGFAKKMYPQIEIFSNTIGTEKCQDVLIAKRLSEKFHIQHTVIPVGLDYFERFTKNGVNRSEGYLRAFESWILAENDFLSKKQPATVMLGLLGNVLNGRYWPAGDINNEAIIINHLLKKKRLIPVLTSIFKPELTKFIPIVFETLVRLYHQAPYSTPVRKLDSLNMRLGNHRHAATPDTLGDHAFYYEPFMDQDLVEFCNATPVHFLQNGHIVKSVIQRYIPEITQIGYYSPLIPLKFALSLDKLNLWNPFLNNYRRIIRRLKFPDNDNPFGYVYPNQALRTGSRDFVIQTIREKAIYEDYLNPDAVFQLFDDHFQKKTNDYYPLSSILTFIHWLKIFVYNQEII